ncbi:DUF1307 domain-containing protein [Enterococcus gallinarum]|uniref:DUF1307 domain-containing protein n=1 Tax=Enterococcus gallinarum TaxID=1353 RepID=UPI003BF7F20B
MKKTVVGFIALLGIFFLASCGANGANQKTKTFTNEQNGVQMELVFNYEGDEVKKQTANNIMPYSSVGGLHQRGSAAIIGSDCQAV